MACGGNCPCCKDKKKAKKRVTKKKAAVPARAPPHRMVNINVLPPVGEGAPRWKKDLVSVDTIGGLPSPVKKYSTVGTQTDRPRTNTIATLTDRPRTNTIATLTDRPRTNTIATLTDRPRTNTIATLTDRPRTNTIATLTDRPRTNTIATLTDRPRINTIETQTEKAIKEELQAPRPAKYIRQPVSVSTREPTMAVVEPPSRYARQLEIIRRRMPYNEIPTPRVRTAEMITQTEDAPSGTRVTKRFEVVPETRGRPVSSENANQRLIDEMFRRE